MARPLLAVILVAPMIALPLAQAQFGGDIGTRDGYVAAIVNVYNSAQVWYWRNATADGDQVELRLRVCAGTVTLGVTLCRDQRLHP